MVGRNGAGKTTLLKILTGQMKPDVGSITFQTHKISYLSQFLEMTKDASIDEAVSNAPARVDAIKARIADIECQMSSNDPHVDWNSLGEEYVRLQGELDEAISGDARRTRSVMAEIGFESENINRTMGELSGGEVTKVMLARVLAQAENSELLFLDEPTSHLDIDTVEWLESYLLNLKAAVVVVSHDRYFLDKVVTKVIELEDGKLRQYSGNYSMFIEKKAMEIERQRIAYEKNRVERERQEHIAEYQHQREWFSSTHKVRLKMIDRMDEVDKPKEYRDIRVKVTSSGKAGKNFIIAKDLAVERGNKVVLDTIDLDLQVGEKLGIFGPNGAGKTTLLKAVLRDIPFKGELWVAPGAKVGYYAQGQDMLDSTLSAEEHILRVVGRDKRQEARDLLARFLLSGDQVERGTGTLSGGERARVALALLIAEKRNLLILDEPTNYLDIPSQHAIENALVEYSGSILVVTHDRYFMDSVCNKVGELRNRKLTVFPGNYSQMRGSMPRASFIEQANAYKVISGFTDWTTGKKYRAGDKVVIAPSETENFRWALDTGKLKKTSETSKKIVKG